MNGDPAPESARPRPPMALALAGGGFPGVFFELGAVAALEAGFPGWRARDCRRMVGTSCGALVGAILGFGLDPAEALTALSDRSHPLAPRFRELSAFPWKAHARGLARALGALPRLVRENAGGGHEGWTGLAQGLQEQFPAGFFSNRGIPELVARAARRAGCRDRFEDLRVPLRITATDVDTGERVVFGGGGAADPPVSAAVGASTAIPGYYVPVRVGERDLMDGQIVDPIHLDLAAEPGVRVVVGVSPLGVYRRGPDRPARIREGGSAAVMDQMARISAAIKLGASRERLARERPEVAVRMVHPRPEDVYFLVRARFEPRSLARAWGMGFAAAAAGLEGDGAEWEALLGPLGFTLDRESLAAAASRFGPEVQG